MNQASEPAIEIEESLAEGIAAIMAADEDLPHGEDVPHPEDLADLFLDELNRLWAEPQPLTLS